MKKKYINLFLRYFLIIALAFPNLYLFYLIFTPLTIYPLYFLFNLFFQATLSGNTFLIGNFSIQIINACIAGSAYYLLFILNLSIPNIKLKKRIKMLLFAFSFLLIINILRIFFLFVILSFLGYSYFAFTHKVFWYVLNILFVIAIWFAEVKFLKIKQIPFYSDLKFLYKKSSLKNIKILKNKVNKSKSSKKN